MNNFLGKLETAFGKVVIFTATEANFRIAFIVLLLLSQTILNPLPIFISGIFAAMFFMVAIARTTYLDLGFTMLVMTVMYILLPFGYVIFLPLLLDNSFIYDIKRKYPKLFMK